MFEKLIAGVNHGEIGALIAEKWNFPDVIVNVIRFHHIPEEAPKDMRKITSLVYLADMMAHYVDKTVDYYQFDNDILAQFKITSEEQVQTITARMEQSFMKGQK